MGEAITILALLVVTLVVYFLFLKITRIRINIFGLILLWPIVISFVNDYSAITKWISFALVLVAIYLLFRKSKRIESIA